MAFAGQIFFDFAGYSICAIGAALCLGFHLKDNFRFPYAAIGFSDFWRRWHISLSTFLRDYLYIPIGGNRAGAARAMVNLMIVMFIGGLWHGAAWTFVVWGLLHGSYLALERLRESHRRRAGLGESSVGKIVSRSRHLLRGLRRVGFLSRLRFYGRGADAERHVRRTSARRRAPQHARAFADRGCDRVHDRGSLVAPRYDDRSRRQPHAGLGPDRPLDVHGRAPSCSRKETAMHSSTSNFERVIPDPAVARHHGQRRDDPSVATAVWEIYRSLGYGPTLNDTDDLWAKVRRRVEPESIVIIGRFAGAL